jgi:hypothetical protein
MRCVAFDETEEMNDINREGRRNEEEKKDVWMIRGRRERREVRGVGGVP